MQVAVPCGKMHHAPGVALLTKNGNEKINKNKKISSNVNM
jgi:hypothetical protein